MEVDPPLSPVALGHDDQRDQAALGELARVRQQVEQALTYPARVRDHAVRRGVDLEHHVVAALDRHRPHRRDHVDDQGSQLEDARLDIETPGLDLGQVEHVVDDRQQVPPGVIDAVEIFDQARLAQLFEILLHQLGVADHRVQRRAQFVAHVRQELALGGVGRVGGVPGVLQLDHDSLQRPIPRRELGGHVVDPGSQRLVEALQSPRHRDHDALLPHLGHDHEEECHAVGEQPEHVPPPPGRVPEL